MPVRRSLMGVGPKVAVTAAPMVVAAIVATVFFREACRVPLPRMFELQLGVLLLTIGLLMYGNAAFHLVRDFKRGVLITEGAYAWSQNPLYASFIFFLVPAIALFADSWPAFLVSVVMYVTVKALIGAEYAELEAAFGERYREYRERTAEMFPLPQRMGRRSVSH